MLHLFRDKKRSRVIQLVVALGVVFTFLLGFNFLFGSGAGSNPEKSGVMGSINGKNITVDEYRSMVSQQIEGYRQQSGRPVDEATAAYLRDAVWNNMIQQRAFAEKAQSMGLGASDREVVYAARNLPPQDVAQIPAFQTNGQFDMAKYRRMLDDPKMPVTFLANLEAQMRQTLPTMKLQTLAASMGKVTDPEAQAAIARTEERVAVTLVPFQVTAATAVQPNQVTRPEMEAWFEKHKAEFKRDEEASISVVSVTKNATIEDQKSAESQAQNFYREARQDTGFTALANQVSDQPVGSTPTGKPGNFVEMGQLVHALEDAIWALKPGEITPPVLSGDSYHIVKYIGPVTDKGKDKRHIIDLKVSVHAGEASLAKARAELDQIREQARKDGLDNAASRAKKQLFRTGFFTEDAPPPALAELPELVRFAFQNKKGELSEIVDKPGALLLVQVTDRRSAGQRSLSDLESEVRSRVAQDKSVDKAEEQAKQFLSQVTAAGSLENAAKALKMSLATESFARNGPFMNPILKGEPRVVGAAFGLPVGQPRVIRGDQGAYLLRVTDRPALDPARVAGQMLQTKQSLSQQKRQEYLQTWSKEIQRDAKVKDFRAQMKSAG